MAAKRNSKARTVGVQVKGDDVGRAFDKDLRYSRAMLGYTSDSQTLREAVRRLAASLRGSASCANLCNKQQA